MNLDIIRLDEDTGNINYDVHWGFDVWDLVTMVIPSDESRDEAKTREQNICNHLLNVLNVDVLVQLIMVYWNRVNVADSLHKKFQLHGILNWKGPEDRFPGRYRVLNMNNPNSMKPLVEIKKFHETIFRDLQFDHLRWFIIDCPGIQELHSFCGRTLTRTEIQLIVGSNQMVGIYKGKPFFIF
jgi:small-conductance mechanosensitive channel